MLQNAFSFITFQLSASKLEPHFPPYFSISPLNLVSCIELCRNNAIGFEALLSRVRARFRAFTLLRRVEAAQRSALGRRTEIEFRNRPNIFVVSHLRHLSFSLSLPAIADIVVAVVVVVVVVVVVIVVAAVVMVCLLKPPRARIHAHARTCSVSRREHRLFSFLSLSSLCL